MSSWKDQFVSIDACVIVSDGANTLTTDKYAQKSSSCGCEPSPSGGKMCCDHRCINYSTQTECFRCKPECRNRRFQNKDYAKLAVIETPGKGHGLFAAEDLKGMQFLMEYVGEIIDDAEFARRSSERGRLLEHQFIMQLKPGVLLDAGRKGSISRFINHSCEPNCYVEIWTVQGHLRVGIFCMYDLKEGTELTFDYKWSKSARPPTRCHCGTESCRGFLEILTEADKAELRNQKGVWRPGGEPLVQPKQSNITTTSSDNTADSAGEGDTTTASSNVPSVLTDIYNADGLLVPELLIGRRVKVWWAGNLAYLEADVESYNKKNNMYLCRYLVDDSISEEDFGPSVGFVKSATNGSSETQNKSSAGIGAVTVKWYWRDASVEETVIKKKASAEMLGDDYVSNLSDSDELSNGPTSRPNALNHSNGYNNHNSTAASYATSTTIRHVATITAGVARTLVDMYAPGSDNGDAGVAFVSSPSLSDWQNLTHIFQRNLNVKVTLLSATDENAALTTAALESKKLVMYGEQPAISLAAQVLLQAEKAHHLAHSSKTDAKNKQLRNRQSIVLTNDWRFKSAIVPPTPPASNGETENGLQFGSFEAYFAHKLRSVPDMSCLSILNHTDLPAGVSAGTNAELSENVRKTLVLNLQQLCVKLGFSASQSQHALMVMVRYLRFVSGNVMKESTAITAAVALLVAKHSADFKYKNVGNIVRSAYCTVFKRDEVDVTIVSIEHYIDAALEKERHLYNKVYHDLYSADVLPFLHSQVKGGMWSDKWRFEMDSQSTETDANTPNNSAQKDKHKDREAEKLKRKKNATFQYEMNIRYGVRRSVLHVGEGLARDLMNVFSISNGTGGASGSSTGYNNSNGVGSGECSMVLSVLPVEVVQLSCILVVSLLHTSLPSVALHKRIINEVDSYAAELVHTALYVLHYSAPLLRWCTEVFAEACVDQLATLCELYDCFKELKDSKTDVVRLLRVTVPGVLNKIIASVTSTSNTAVSTSSTTNNSSHASPAGNTNAPPLPSAPLPPLPSTSINPSQPFHNSDEPCKQRFPWLTSSAEQTESGMNSVYSMNGGVELHSSLTLSAFEKGKYCPHSNNNKGDSPLIACGKDVYFGFASLHTDGGKCLPRLACVDPSAVNTHSIRNSSSTSTGLMSIRAFPSHKHTAREAKRAGYDDVTQLGSLPTTLSELHTLQHLHYFFSAKGNVPEVAYVEHLAGECPYFVAPVGVVTLAKEVLNENYALRDAVLGVDDDLNNAYSLKQFENKGLVNQLLHQSRPPVNVDLQFLAFPAVHVSLATLVGSFTPRDSARWKLTEECLQNTEHRGALRVLENNNGHLIPPALAVDLCRDLYAAVAHMVSCGVYLKWLVLDHMYLTSGGRLQIGGLTGAVMVSTSATNGTYFGGDGSKSTSAGPSAAGNMDEGDDPPSITQLSAELTFLKTGHRNSAVTSGNTPKKRKFTLGATFDDEEEEENSNKYDTQCRRLVAKMALSRSALYTVAPELLLGAKPSAESTVYAAGAVAVQILTGRPLVKNASAEDKQLQFVYKTLGTPKPMDFPDFDLLPLAQYYGRHIVDDEDSKLRESRSRAYKALRDMCPASLLAAYSYPSAASATDNRQAALTITGIPTSRALQVTTATGDSDYAGILDLIRVSMMLVPHRRLHAELLLSFRVFSDGNKLVESPGYTARTEFVSSKLHLTSGTALSVRGLTAVSRLSHMEEMVSFLRAIQRVPAEAAKKDNSVSADQVEKLVQMDAILFRKERSKHTHGESYALSDKDPRGYRANEHKPHSEGSSAGGSSSTHRQERVHSSQYPVAPPVPLPPAPSRAAAPVSNHGALYPSYAPPTVHVGGYSNYQQYPSYPQNPYPAYSAPVVAPVYPVYSTNLYNNNSHNGYDESYRRAPPPPPAGGIPRAPAVPPPPARSPRAEDLPPTSYDGYSRGAGHINGGSRSPASSEAKRSRPSL